VDYDITSTVCSVDFARALNRYTAKHRKKINVHVKVDTGMGRLGVWHKEAIHFIRNLKRLSHISIEGLYTHFPCADTDPKFTLKQIADFKNLINELQKCKIHIPLCHAANSMGIIGYKESYFDMVRPGLMIYGLYPKDGLEAEIKLKPAMSLKSKVIFIKKTPKGRTISYGATHITAKPTYIATIPVGYNDGYSRNLSNKAQVLIKGKFRRVVGRICMDQLMADAIKSDVKLGDVVTLIGRDKNNFISVEEISCLAGTIPYEIACGVGNGAKRFYKV
jgi:alanine racemase